VYALDNLDGQRDQKLLVAGRYSGIFSVIYCSGWKIAGNALELTIKGEIESLFILSGYY
jgi:hypothetical protein